jgi:hypothetical protein
MYLTTCFTRKNSDDAARFFIAALKEASAPLPTVHLDDLAA